MKKILFLLCITSQLWAQHYTISGKVVNQTGENLPFASINAGMQGTMTNELGDYKIQLEKGKHEIKIQYLGYSTFVKTIEVAENKDSLIFVLTQNIINLKDLVVNKRNSASEIMRKTIDNSDEHHFEVSGFKMNNYVKGTFLIKDLPFFIEKKVKKDFIEKNQTFILESLNEVSFSQPNNYHERVIAARSNLPKNLQGGSSLSFGMLQFYNPENRFSPITPKGSKNYNFEYLGFFEDNGQIVNRIEVKPKGKNLEFFDGVINIIDQSWYLHSLEGVVKTNQLSVKLSVIYSPIQGIWMMRQTKISQELDLMGIKAQMTAVSNYKDYEIEISKDLKPRKILEESFVKSEDSLAKKRSDEYWNSVRPIPLTESDQMAFKSADSLYKLKAVEIDKKISSDSLKRINENRFRIKDLILWGEYKTKKLNSKLYANQFFFRGLIYNLRYTAVDGLRVGLGFKYTYNADSVNHLTLQPNLYYSVGLKQFYGKISTDYRSDRLGAKLNYLNENVQINSSNPVGFLVNSFYALFMGEHPAKMFHNQGFEAQASFDFNSNWHIKGGFKVHNRYPLNNTVDASPVFQKDKPYEPNLVIDASKQKIFEVGLRYRPNVKLNYINYKKSESFDTELSINHQLFFNPELFGRVELTAFKKLFWLENTFKIGTESGFFYGNKNNNFLDYKHFMGNDLKLQSHYGFRNLPYYTFSTNQHYIQFFAEAKFKKILLGFLKIPGLTENIFSNYLKTPNISHFELGYGIDLFSGAIGVEIYTTFPEKTMGWRLFSKNLLRNDW